MPDDSGCPNCGDRTESCNCPDSLRIPQRCKAVFFDRGCILAKEHTGYHKNDKGNRWGDTGVVLGRDCGKVYAASGVPCLQLKGHPGNHQKGIIEWTDAVCEDAVHN